MNTTIIENQVNKLLKTCMQTSSVNPFTGKVEFTTGDDNWQELVKAIVAAARGVEPFNSSNAASGLEQIVMWPGGKKNELKHIIPALPSYERFIDPFCGGGSVYMGINAHEYCINDFSTDLISLYRYIQEGNQEFFNYVNDIEKTWQRAKAVSDKYLDTLYKMYRSFYAGRIHNKTIKGIISDFCNKHQDEILEIFKEFKGFPCIILKEVVKYLCRRMKSMKKKGVTERDGFHKNLETSFKGAHYINYRLIYNDQSIKETNNPLHTAVFLFIRQTAFGGKFSYNKKGEYNEGYGGISCNATTLANKLAYYNSPQLREHFDKTHIYNMDFEEFLRIVQPNERDVLFLDPPYDSEFSSYDNHDFNRDDHRRLANYLLNECKAKWMMIIGMTDFIYDLYNQEGIYIQSNEKVYTGNMKNNNNRKVTHLLITNYKVETQSLSIAA